MLAAASLARAFSEIEEHLEAQQKDLDVLLEISGSQEACRKVAELGRRADVVASADAGIIDQILRPGHVDFTIEFATNEVVLAHMQHSRHTEQINQKNWPEILLRPDVRLGRVDPDLAPIGYRTLLVWKLAEIERAGRHQTPADLARRLTARCAAEHVAPHEGELMQMLQSRALDYAFVYRSTAEEHNLKTVILPDAINLGAAERAADYARVSVPVRLKAREQKHSVRGAPVVYGVTIPRHPPNPRGAEAFVRALLDRNGQRALKRTGFRPLLPPRCVRCSGLPVSLRGLIP